MLMCVMEEKPDLMAKDNAGRCGCGELGHKAIVKWWNEGYLKVVLSLNIPISCVIGRQKVAREANSL